MQNALRLFFGSSTIQPQYISGPELPLTLQNAGSVQHGDHFYAVGGQRLVGSTWYRLKTVLKFDNIAWAWIQLPESLAVLSTWKSFLTAFAVERAFFPGSCIDPAVIRPLGNSIIDYYYINSGIS